MKRAAIGAAAVAVVLLAIAIHRVTLDEPAPPPAPVTAEHAEAPTISLQLLTPDRPIGPDDDLDRATIDRLRLHAGPARGPASAHVTIVMFLDMQCPYCKRSLAVLDTLWPEYPDRLRLVVKHYPVRPGSELHAQALSSTTSEDAFWRMFDLLVENPAPHDHAALRAFAERAGNDMRMYDTFHGQHLYQRPLAADRAAADALAVRATPVFFINGKRRVGAMTIDQMRDAIEIALASPAP